MLGTCGAWPATISGRTIVSIAPCWRWSSGEFEAEQTSFFPSIKETLNHIHLVDLFYFDMLEERRHRASQLVRASTPYEDAQDLADAQAKFDRNSWLSAMACPDADLDRPSRPTAARPASIPERIGDLLAHLLPARHPSPRPSACDAVRHLGRAAAARRISARLRSAVPARRGRTARPDRAAAGSPRSILDDRLQLDARRRSPAGRVPLQR